MAFGKKNKENDAAENVEKGGKSNRGVMVVLFILGLLVLGAATFGGVYLFMKQSKTVEAQEVVVENAYMDLAEFTVNLADEGGKRYFKGELSLGYDKTKTKFQQELTENQVVIRDDIIFFFKSQKADFINNVANRETMKKELIEAINKDLTKGKITDIRFKSMLVQ
ncbi:flagellar FliL protein [Clostridium saccharoperbutylacetonicum]|uniref:Flagellar protein FliL n=1 Tax=Clostridium saccharoperbutylacetonicum N1-4(HMT) TaxID=931276 RepID=M1LYE3_9CLOT|nr:flagellar basal body-associated FliL family protein [Clostridium saccharoperbutylacetonicum]AGF58265.1 flagellar basal body protein FliL [Clostridium saccharoperbutylacetonicum N1-4(HMT)]NRT60958.1 flagellar FliL protein [Clostridium saccharoperbutylacetonicum]NSB24271.1 flagellar FliL protein [Clostridium saccharoperbutylacetonicum]NSB43649.1 flagellar FliL protein [Clostridium saccharoperbutylacetonicum]